jgi:preprotein translocase subunit SecF
MEFFPIGRVYDFMGQRRLFAVISAIVILGSAFLVVWPGPNLGTDFKGGTELEVDFPQGVTTPEIRGAVEAAGFATPEVVAVEEASHKNRYLIRVQEVSTISTQKQDELTRLLCVGEKPAPDCAPEKVATELKVSPGGDKIAVRYREAPDLAWIRERMKTVSGIAMREGDNNPALVSARDNKVEISIKSKGDQLLDGLKEKLGPGKAPDKALRVEWIGPKAGAQLRDSAIQSIVIAIVFVMIYIAFRFDLRFAPGVVLSLVHDAVAVMGMFVLLRKEVNLTTVAALLTVVGYSVNDTVVVYDRVRENLGHLRGATFETIINKSISEMLGRTILTNATVVMSLLAFFVWGTGPLKDFSLALILGVLFGTYSSVYIALPLTWWLDVTFFNKGGSGGSGGKKQHRPQKKTAAVV